MTAEQAKRLTRQQAQAKLDEMKEGRSDWAKDFNPRFFKACAAGPGPRDETIDVFNALSAAANAPEAEAERKAAQIKCSFTPEQILEARTTISQMKSSPVFQKAFWSANEIGHAQAVDSWNAAFEIGHAPGAEEVLAR